MTEQCHVCMHQCRIPQGKTGLCQARKNEAGTIICTNYGKLTALALDPIEKKPLKRFYPGSMILSVGSYGCNLHCPFCQNSHISMAGEGQVQTVDVSPEDLAGRAAALEKKGNIGLAFTYNEPLIGYEYVRDAARITNQMGMKNVVVTNGTANPWVLDEILPYIDAMNIDLKGFRGQYYQKLGGNLETVKDTIRQCIGSCHVELTTLIVPGENDTPEEMQKLACWVAGIDPDIVLHVTRFFPRWKMKDRQATDVAHVYGLAQEARKYLHYVYEGNC